MFAWHGTALPWKGSRLEAQRLLESGRKLGMHKCAAQKFAYRWLRPSGLFHPWVWVTVSFPLWPSQDTREGCSEEFKPGRLQTWAPGTRVRGLLARGALSANQLPKGRVTVVISPSFPLKTDGRQPDLTQHLERLSFISSFGLWFSMLDQKKKWKRFNFTPSCLLLSLGAGLSSWQVNFVKLVIVGWRWRAEHLVPAVTPSG